MRFSGLVLFLAGFAVALAGLHFGDETLRSGALIATGNAVRNGGLELSRADLESAAARLEAVSAPDPSADEAGALTFLHYAAADQAMRADDITGAHQELEAAKRNARQTLRRAPTRADAALALAEIEYLEGGGMEAIAPPLLLSYQSAPRELWIVERRIGLGLRVASDANPELLRNIDADIRIMGEPFRDVALYRELAEAAHNAGPYAVALVREQLATQIDQPLQTFNKDLAALEAPPRP